MKPKLSFKLSRGAKLAVLAVVAVLLPIAVLSVIQYRSLVELESKTKVAVQESLRQSLRGVARRVQERLETLAGEVVGRIDPAKIELKQPEQLAPQLTALKQAHPEIDNLFFVVNCQCQSDTFALFSTSAGTQLVRPDQFKESRETQSILDAYNRATAARASTDGLSNFFYDQTNCLALGNHEAGLFHVSLFSHVLKPGGKEPLGFLGMTVSSNYIRETLLPQAISELLPGSTAGATESAVALSIFNEHGQMLYPIHQHHQSQSAQHAQISLARPEARVPFNPVFRRWELGGSYQGTTIEALARDNFRKNLLLTGLVLALLMLGLILTLRATAREIRLAQAKTSFVSNVSHELKTPLALIRLFAETLELDRVKSPEKAHEYYRIIHHESRRLTQLINNILDFSKIEAGRREYQFAEADVAEVVSEVLRSYEYQLTNAGFEVKTEIQSHLPPALIDREALTQAALNLLNNAVKYSAETKEITVRVQAREGQIAMEVADQGIGIARSEHEKIFEKFYRVSTGLVHDTKGSGLGLALVKHIAAAHGGRVTLESAPGQGSRFTILIPISQTAAPQTQTPEAGGYRVAENPHH